MCSDGDIMRRRRHLDGAGLQEPQYSGVSERERDGGDELWQTPHLFGAGDTEGVRRSVWFSLCEKY